jgi:zinc transport system ATP-binding protein
MQKVDHTVNIIEVRDVSFSYGAVEALKSITLDIHRGDYLGMIGPNGAGKTTLIKIMLGLIKPDTGNIKMFGQDIEHFRDWSKIGYVYQKTTSFDINFPATVQEVVLMGRYPRRGLLRRLTKSDRQFAREALEQVNMWPLKDRLIGDLSGGQQQRVFIARALASQPEVIFLDEPTTGVDLKAQDEFYALLRKLNREFGMTLILVTHDVERIYQEAMHIACVDHILVCHSSPEEFLKESRSMKMFGENFRIFGHHHHL